MILKVLPEFLIPPNSPPGHLTEINPLRLQVLLEFAAPKPRPGDLGGSSWD
jgi:hypothetical protein